MWAPLHMRKIFVGGIDYTTTDDTLREHFSSWGDVVDAVVMKDMTNNRSRGFGFVTFGSPDHVDAVQKARPHKVDGRLVETKRAVPRGEANNSVLSQTSHPDPTHNRIFIGGLPQDVKEEDLETYFANFGRVTCVNIMYDKNSGRHRGFAFVDFNDYDPVDKVLLMRNHSIKGRLIDVKKAISKSDISKIKSIMTGAMGGPEQGFYGGFGTGSNDGTPAATPLPGAMASTSNAVSMNGSAGGRYGAPGGPGGGGNPGGGNMGMPPMGHHFFPRLPMAGLPGFSAQLRSGWQYSLSGNAEVLRNTAGADCT
ncbi:Heterogeneous nuclear ribonucleoprotein 87F [Chionoecetes opilio]|uniref:Heterogeneous nuclear ribonucleoprotein 87F n=1 Tax=Chionoecetes opilio TaxID=41210 RepID=A0A8J4YPZ8_CHIOP|nr:Heterogeneous nuclear ribonucleoprotein 87F [Chionoecetes opilio]